MTSMKRDMREICEQTLKETELKFKKLVMMESQLNMLRSEQELMRSKNKRDLDKEKEEKHLLAEKIRKMEKDLEGLSQKLDILASEHGSQL